MANPAGKRGTVAAVGGVDHSDIIRKANLAEEDLNRLKPYFDMVKAALHNAWESLPLDDGPAAKTIKFELYTVKKLEQAIEKTITLGEISKKKVAGEYK